MNQPASSLTWGMKRQVDACLTDIIRMVNMPGLGLRLADGTNWVIRAGDEPARCIVTALGEAAQLQLVTFGRELLAVVRQEGSIPPANLSGRGAATCLLPPPSNRDMLTIGMMHLSLAIACDVSRRGGMLLHGALAEYGPHPFPPLPLRGRGAGGEGVLLAGPGTVGKTTASNRLPLPWRSLCDDTTLVVCDPTGQYWAHPWPTWSRFYDTDGNPGPGGSWDVQHAVPLRAIFFLSQAPEDRVSSLHPAQATALLMESVQQASGTMTRRMEEDKVHALYHEQLRAVERLAGAIPAHRLEVSLTGEFWKEIEGVLETLERDWPQADTGYQQTMSAVPSSDPTLTAEEILDDDTLWVVYTGPSMNPTLREPDLLLVRPTGRQLVRIGDVIYFPSPEDGAFIVHRVVSVTPDGVQTRGDNNARDDPYQLPFESIIGCVVATRRGQRRRRVAGGMGGRIIGFFARIWRVANVWGGRLFHKVYRAIARFDFLRRLLPLRWRPRVVCFQTRWQTYLKLMVGERVIGKYDARRETWHIRRPFRLLVDEVRLPKPALQPTRPRLNSNV